MSLSQSDFIVLWGTSILAWLALSYTFYGKSRVRKSEIGDDIRALNARKGYDQSVARDDLARDFIVPFFRSYIDEFARNNRIDSEEYLSALRSRLGRKTILRSAILVNSLGAVYALGGLTYFVSGGAFDPLTYVVTVYFFLSIGFTLYWLS